MLVVVVRRENQHFYGLDPLNQRLRPSGIYFRPYFAFQMIIQSVLCVFYLERWGPRR